jgi:hypothetical protein
LHFGDHLIEESGASRDDHYGWLRLGSWLKEADQVSL